MARRRQHRQTESQARNDFEIPKIQQINAHYCPPKSTDITAIRQAGRRLGINHDRIETRADTSSLLNNCHQNSRFEGCISVSLCSAMEPSGWSHKVAGAFPLPVLS